MNSTHPGAEHGDDGATARDGASRAVARIRLNAAFGIRCGAAASVVSPTGEQRPIEQTG
jgi:hypothetical protein